MSGVAVAWYLLKTNAPLIAVVPAARIKAGELALNTELPAISITEISSIPRLTIAMDETPRLFTDRVQVSWLVKASDSYPSGLDYPGKKAIALLVLAALPNQHGTVNGITVDSILPDNSGPDIFSDAGFVQESRDFIVKWKL